MFKILALVAIFGAQQILAEKKLVFTPLDYCEHFTGQDRYTDFFKTDEKDGVNSCSFYVIASKSPHMQLNNEPQGTGDYYEMVFMDRSELRSCKNGDSCTVMTSASRPGILTHEPIPCKIVTKLEGGRRLVELFIFNEETAFLSAYDNSPMGVSYYSMYSYGAPSQFFHKCTEPKGCSGLIAALLAELNNVIKFLTITLKKAGLTVNQVTNLLDVVVCGGDIGEALGNVVDSAVGDLVAPTINHAVSWTANLFG